MKKETNSLVINLSRKIKKGKELRHIKRDTLQTGKTVSKIFHKPISKIITGNG